MAQYWSGELDRVFWDQDGILLSAVDVETEGHVQHSRCPFRNSYENSVMAMGSLMEATVCRLGVEADTRSRRLLSQLIECFERLFETSYLPGILPRPHSGCSSVDQMLYCAHAYDVALLSGLLEAAEESLVRRRIADMAEYWRNADYGLVDSEGRVTHRYLGGRDEPLMIAFQALDVVYNGSGDARRALDELLSRNLDGLLTSSVQQAETEAKTHVSHPYVPQMYVYSIDILHRYGMLGIDQAEQGYRSWVDGQANYWLVGGPKDTSGEPLCGLSFLTIVYDGQTDTSSPPPRGRYTGSALGGAWHIAYVNAMAYRQFQERAYRERAVRVLAACSRDYMRWNVTEDPSEIESNTVYDEVSNWYSGYGITCWLQTHWLLRSLGGLPG